MAINKVVLGDQTLIDLTSDTVTPDTLAVGATAHDKTGASIVGTMSSGGGGASTKYGATASTFLGDVDSNGVLQAPTAQTDLVFDGVTEIAGYGLYYKFYRCKGVKSISFPDLLTLSAGNTLSYICDNCTELTHVHFAKVTSISGQRALQNAFSNTSCSSISFPLLQSISGQYALYFAFSGVPLVSVSFPKLKTISGGYAFDHAFYQCSALTSVDFPELEEITADAFYLAFNGATKLANASFPKLKVLGTPENNTCEGQFESTFNSTGAPITLSFPELTAIYCAGTSNYSSGTFRGCSAVTRIDFPKLSIIATGQNSGTYVGHKNIFNGCSKLTELHFGVANQAAIEATEGYSTLWGRGAGNATVYFDL